MDDALALHIGRREAIIAAVRRILVEDLHVQIPTESIEVDAALFGTGMGLDSLDAVELVVAAEQQFGVALPMDVLRGLLRSINTLADLVIDLQDGAAIGAPSATSSTQTDAGARAIREASALTTLPADSVWAIYVRGDDAYDVLDRILPCDMFVRDSQLRHTLLLDEHGRPFADVYVGSDDGDYLLLGEGVPAATALAHLRRYTPPDAKVTFEDLSSTHGVLSLNGPFAWEVMAALEGPGIIGFPYLSFFHPTPDSIFLRAGKTGEFGYDLVVPRTSLDSLRGRLLDCGAPFGCIEASEEALRACVRENWFFDVTRQGRSDLTPVELGLQWRVSFKKDFIGAAALRDRRSNASARRATAIRSAHAMAPGQAVSFDGTSIGTVLDAGPAPTLGGFTGVALLDPRYAHAGIDRYDVGGRRVHTFSPPAVNNRSQFVNPQRHSYAKRDEIEFPEAARVRWDT